MRNKLLVWFAIMLTSSIVMMILFYWYPVSIVGFVALLAIICIALHFTRTVKENEEDPD